MATRANIEALLVRRCGPLMTAAGMAVTVVGSNADLDDPMGWALRAMDVSVSNIVSISDSDISGVSDANMNKFLDYSEYRLLENVLGNLDDVDLSAGPYSESLGQLSATIEGRLERMSKKLQDLYGLLTSSVTFGKITLSFAEHDDDSSE